MKMNRSSTVFLFLLFLVWHHTWAAAQEVVTPHVYDTLQVENPNDGSFLSNLHGGAEANRTHIQQWASHARQCERTVEQRGEYETREEHASRKSKANCGAMWRLRDAAVVRKRALLNYSVDSEEFKFILRLGKASKRGHGRCDVDTRSQCKVNDTYISDIVCWDVSRPLTEMDKGRSLGQVNLEWFKGDLDYAFYLDGNRGRNYRFTPEVSYDEPGMCMHSNSYVFEMTVPAALDRARQLKSVEKDLEMEFVGSTKIFTRRWGQNLRHFFVYVVSGVRLVNTSNDETLFSIK